MHVFRFAVGFLGCRANEVEADALRSALIELGGREVPVGRPADVTVLNTCAVTGDAQAQSRKALRRAHRGSPRGLLIATGCAAQLDPRWLAHLPGVDLVVGNRGKDRLGAILQAYMAASSMGPQRSTARRERLADALRAAGLAAAAAPHPQVPPSGAPTGRRRRSSGAELPSRGSGAALIQWDADPTPHQVTGRAGPIPHSRTRATIKIQDGCPFRCTFCIVSRLRGRPTSRDPEDVLAEARRLVDAGYRELILTGINIGLYGREQAFTAPSAPRCRASAPAGGARDLGTLLASLAAIDGLQRIRLSSLEPMTITTSLLESIAAQPKVARSFHLAVQSGDDGVLRRMSRPYDVAALVETIGRMEARLPFFGLGADVIAGFPGEDEAAFERTLALLERLPIAYLHAFAYSERPGTPAAAFAPVVPVPVRKARVRRLRELDQRLRVRFQRRLEGRRTGVIVERVDDATFTGLGEAYVRLTGEAPGLRVGDWVPVEIGATVGPGLMSCRRLDGRVFPAGDALKDQP